MSLKDIRVADTDSAPTPGHADAVLIRQTLDEILASPPFRSTRQCQDLLRYVVENTLASLDNLLRERVIGAEVFGRPPGYDTGEDPVVRLRAAEVRKRLAQYYQLASGVSPFQIQIPPGSYRATFKAISPCEGHRDALTLEQKSSPGTVLTAAQHEIAVPIVVQHSRRPGKMRLAAIAVAVVAIVGAGFLVFQRLSYDSEAQFHRFWLPITAGSKPVLICMGSNAVYRLSTPYVVQYLAESHSKPTEGFESFPNLPPDKPIEARNFEKAYNSFVALGDVAAASDVVAALTRQGKAFRERFPPDISFAELQNTPTITIGGFNNPLTLTITKDLRFSLADGSRIVDRQNANRGWLVRSNGDSHDAEDYALISRLIDAKTGGPVLSVAGIGQYGTQAGAEFISNPDLVAGVVKSAPKGWSLHNIQIVLHVHIVNYRPISTEVVASACW